MDIQKKKKISFIFSCLSLCLFVLFTILVKTVDVQRAGDSETLIGFASFNSDVFSSLGTNQSWNKITNILFVSSFALAFCFASLGVYELIKTKKLNKVNGKILALGVTYVLIAILYLFFELVIVNYRPIIVNGKLEASYPSSHTFITLTILWTTILFIIQSSKNKSLKLGLVFGGTALSLITIVGRLLSGKHWATDIIGAVLLSLFLILIYYFFTLLFSGKLTESFEVVKTSNENEILKNDSELKEVSQNENFSDSVDSVSEDSKEEKTVQATQENVLTSSEKNQGNLITKGDYYEKP